MLLKIRDYIKEKGQVNLQELSLHCQRDPELLRDMLGHWLRKGVIGRLPAPSGCGSRCHQCHPTVAEVYGWQE